MLAPEVEALGYGRTEYDWAVALMHSRSFIIGTETHVVTPGIDLCNHSLNPTAAVRYSFSQTLPV